MAAIYFIGSRLTRFDPKMKLSNQDSNLVLKQLRELPALKKVSLNKTIIHFTSDNCACTKYSNKHKKLINQKAKSAGFNVLNINLPAELLTIIPSTPSILMVSAIDTLLYFGPYSVGLSCSESNGYVEMVLQNYAKGYHGNLIISEVKGCYCHV